MNVQIVFFAATDPALESSLGGCLATVIFTSSAEKDYQGPPSRTLAERTRFSGAAAKVRKQIRDASHTLSFCCHCPARDRATTDTSVRATWLRGGIQRPVVIGG